MNLENDSNKRVSYLTESTLMRIKHKMNIVRPEVVDGCYIITDLVSEIPSIDTMYLNCTMVKMYQSEHLNMDDALTQELNDDLLVLLRRRDAIIVSTLRRTEFLVIYPTDSDFDFMDNGIVLRGDVQKMADQKLVLIYESLRRSLLTKEMNANEM